MIKNKLTSFIVKKPEEVSEMPDHMFDDLRDMLKDAVFLVPENISHNQRKVVYKVGFLKTVYTALYPEISNKKIYELIDNRWQIFKSVRQMERLYAEYIDLKKKGEI